jgi:RNA-binding protein with serine-rich domain 1
MPSESPPRGRSRTRSHTPTSIARAQSPTRSHTSPKPQSRSRSPRRSISPRSRSASRSRSRSRTPRPRNGNRTRSASRSRSPAGATRSYRDRSYTRSPSRPISRRGVQSSKIVVEKLTKNVTEGHLREIFGTYGRIESFDMPMNRQCKSTIFTPLSLFPSLYVSANRY